MKGSEWMVETKKYFTEEDMIMLDEEVRFVPLTYDKMFKGIFKERLDILKLFVLSQLELDVDPSECKLELLDSELPKMNKNEYQKTVDLYVKIFLSDKKELSTNIKGQLFNIINIDVMVDGQIKTLSNDKKLFIKSYQKSLKENKNYLKEIKIIGLEMHQYE